MLYRNDGSYEVYDATGQYIRFNDHGWITTLIYTEGRLSTVQGPFGHAIALAYDADGNLQTVTDPAGQTITYAYQKPENRLTSVTYQDGSARSYHYENSSFPSYLTGITDERGVRFATFAYNSDGLAMSTEHSGGAQRFTLSYGATTTTVTDALGPMALT